MMLPFIISCTLSSTPDMNPNPGMSTIVFCPHSISCGFFVTPGLFPILRFFPVSAFMELDFPTLLLPKKTIFVMIGRV